MSYCDVEVFLVHVFYATFLKNIFVYVFIYCFKVKVGLILIASQFCLHVICILSFYVIYVAAFYRRAQLSYSVIRTFYT